MEDEIAGPVTPLIGDMQVIPVRLSVLSREFCKEGHCTQIIEFADPSLEFICRASRTCSG